MYFTVLPGRLQIAFVEKYPLFMCGAVLAAWYLGLHATFASVRAILADDMLVIDSHAYWLAAQGGASYDKAPGQRDAYLYSPVFLMAIRPLALVSWPIFLALWVCLQVVVLAWLLQPLRKRWAIPFFLFCLPELLVGNIHILLAGAAVLGMRRPALWAFPVLTKITAGVGLLWFVIRGEWGHLARGIFWTASIVGVSYVFDPASWHAWADFLLVHREGTPDSSFSFVLRCLIAVALVACGARKGWAWVIAPAMVLASPVLTSVIALSMLAAIPRLAMGGGHSRLTAKHDRKKVLG